MNLSVCCANKKGRPVVTSTNSSEFHSWEDQVLSTFHSELLDEKVSSTSRSVLWCCSVRELRRNWLSCLVFPWLSDEIEGSTSIVLSLHRETKFIIVFDFAVTLSSPESFCVLFHITPEQSVELKWVMLNKHKRWFHSLCVKFALVSMSANWFLVSMYLIRILGSKFTRTTNQEQLCGFWENLSLSDFFPLWSSWSVLCCLQTHTTKLPNEKIWRLRELNQHYPNHRLLLKIACVCKLCEVVNKLHVCSLTRRPLLYDFAVFSRTATIRSHNSRADKPSNLSPVSREMISHSVELCETEVCFLHIQLIGTNVRLQKRTMLYTK